MNPDKNTTNSDKMTTSNPTSSIPIIGDGEYTTIYICTSIVSSVISLIGIATNVINMIVFCRQGFSDAVNVSLFGLALSDLGGLTALLYLNICAHPLLIQSVSLPYSPQEIQFLTAGYPRIGFSKITCWITIFITVQRCLCTAFPFKIKTFMTPERTGFIVVFIFVAVFLLTIFPQSCTGAIRIVWKFYPSVNKTLLGIEFGSNFPILENVSGTLITCVQFFSFSVNVLSTSVLFIQLKRRSKWLQKTSANSKITTTKDTRIGKIIILLSTLFIVSYIPSTVFTLFALYIPGYSLGKAQKNFYSVTWSISHLVEASNSASVIIVYYKMSSKYRSTYNKMIFKCKIRFYG